VKFNILWGDGFKIFREKYLPVYFNLNLISLFRRKNAMKKFLVLLIALIMIATLLVVPGVQTSGRRVIC